MSNDTYLATVQLEGAADVATKLDGVGKASERAALHTQRSFMNIRQGIIGLLSGDLVGAADGLGRGLATKLGGGFLKMLPGIGGIVTAAMAGWQLGKMLDKQFDIGKKLFRDVEEAPFKAWRAEADALNESLKKIDEQKFDNLKDSADKLISALERANSAYKAMLAAQSEVVGAEGNLELAKTEADTSLSPEEKINKTAGVKERNANRQTMMQEANVDRERGAAETNIKAYWDIIKQANDMAKSAADQYKVASPENRGAYREKKERAELFAKETSAKYVDKIASAKEVIENTPARQEAIQANAAASKISINTERDKALKDERARAVKEANDKLDAEKKTKADYAQAKADVARQNFEGLSPAERLKQSQAALDQITARGGELEGRRSKGTITAGEQTELISLLKKFVVARGDVAQAKKDVADESKAEADRTDKAPSAQEKIRELMGRQVRSVSVGDVIARQADIRAGKRPQGDVARRTLEVQEKIAKLTETIAANSGGIK